jgi:hypothetical protein
VESLFASLKKEFVQGADFATWVETRTAVVAYIEVFCNSQRRPSSLGYVSPAEYERKSRYPPVHFSWATRPRRTGSP